MELVKLMMVFAQAVEWELLVSLKFCEADSNAGSLSVMEINHRFFLESFGTC